MLKAFMCLLIVIATCHSAAGYTNDSLEYVKQVRYFINHARIETLNDPMNILDDLPAGLDSSMADCLKEIRNDTIHISKEDLEYIRKELGKSRITKWPSDISPMIKVVSSDTINRIFSSPKLDWAYFFKNIGRSMNIFSLPIFFGDKYCLFYSGNTCGGLCGSGSWKLYRKEGEFWFVIREYCNWVS